MNFNLDSYRRTAARQLLNFITMHLGLTRVEFGTQISEAIGWKDKSGNPLSETAARSRVDRMLDTDRPRSIDWPFVVFMRKKYGITFDYLLGETDDPYEEVTLKADSEEVQEAYELLGKRSKRLIGIIIQDFLLEEQTESDAMSLADMRAQASRGSQEKRDMIDRLLQHEGAEKFLNELATLVNSETDDKDD